MTVHDPVAALPTAQPIESTPVRTAPWLSLREVVSKPLPHLDGSPITRFLTRSTLALFRGNLLEVRGLEHIQPERDPFIIALNHSQRAEAILIPGFLFHLRAGKRIHFLADWNFCLIPPVWVMYRCAQVIRIARKPAKPAFLNAFKPLFTDKEPGFDRARRVLESGASVGIFPEGTVNRHPSRLLKGYSGAAQLSLQSGVKVIPVGVKFPTNPAGKPIAPLAPMVLDIGAPLVPPAKMAEPDLEFIRSWHETIMQRISELSGKEWQSQTRRKQTCH
ncbi:MAG TPA: lysophospholipid acyltransferase family protein [Roseimicrobium sp.]|nr:lysophospholipid acyltransferase family protein [Roseimicrobium sp.]